MTDARQADQALKTWIAAVGSGDPARVTPLYEENAVLLPTLRGEVCSTPESRGDYFNHFVAKIPQGTVTEMRSKQLKGGIVVQDGHYTFTFQDGTTAEARFSFVYGQDGKIINHHSSLNPNAAAKASSNEAKTTDKKNETDFEKLQGHIQPPQTQDEKEVQAALKKWIEANATGNPENVTALYKEDAVLLPTLSGKICDTEESRRNYFDHFTTKVPSGTVYDLHTRVEGDVAINSGHYAFHFKDGSTALARFDFVYEKGDKGWQIVSHHSSLNPGGSEKDHGLTHDEKGPQKPPRSKGPFGECAPQV